ncbi:unnamed protein product [Symbiodinium necroappetens]|uniref:Uncharacterized protein n=1 Tax=Symbiodinium necroappetens TaxID=1628268 RepID=A0A812V6P9_9DINO|nr:unnamed protein product [Symbiodinium necroappetens]
MIDNGEGSECNEQLLRIHEALKTIRDHDVFKDIDNAKPLTVSQGASQTPYDRAQAQAALGNNSCYTCGANFFWADQIWLPNHRVTNNSGQILALQARFLPPLEPPATFPFTVTVAVDSANDEVLEGKGFQRLSPAEPCHAMLYSIQEAITGKADAAVLQAWRKLLLTTPFRFELVAMGEPRYWKAANLREDIVEKGVMVTMSARQRIYDVVGFKKAKEKALGASLTSQQVADAYTARLKLSSQAERITKSFVDAAVQVHDKVFKSERSRIMLAWCDRHFLSKNPWDSVYLMQDLAVRAQSPDLIAECLHGLVDGFRMGFLKKGTFVSSVLRDPRQSYIEVLKLKVKLRDALLTDWLDSTSMPQSWKQKLREAFSSFDAVRERYSSYPDEEQAASAWVLGAPESVSLAADLLDQLIYKDNFDGRFKDAVKTHHETADFLDYPSVKSKIAEVEDALRKESKPTVADPATATDGGSTSAAASTAATQPSKASTDSPANATGFQKLSSSEQDEWRAFMLKQLRATLRFIPDSGSANQLEQSLKDNPYAVLQGDPLGTVLLHFDVKKSGEAATRPDLRKTPLREAPYCRAVRAVLEARGKSPGQPGTLNSAEIAVVLDGGRPGNRKKLLQPWKVGTRLEMNEDEDDEAAAPAEDDEDDDQKPGLVIEPLMIGVQRKKPCDQTHEMPGNSYAETTGDVLRHVRQPPQLAIARTEALRGHHQRRLAVWGGSSNTCRRVASPLAGEKTIVRQEKHPPGGRKDRGGK